MTLLDYFSLACNDDRAWREKFLRRKPSRPGNALSVTLLHSVSASLLPPVKGSHEASLPVLSELAGSVAGRLRRFMMVFLDSDKRIGVLLHTVEPLHSSDQRQLECLLSFRETKLKQTK